MTILTPLDFLRRVWPQTLLTHENFELRIINRNTQRIRRQFCPSIGTFLKRASEYAKYEVYFGVATRFGEGGKKKDCYRTQAVWADLDNRNINDLGDLDPRPDIIVDSGGGAHAYWLLSSPVLVKDERWKEIEAINRTIAKKLGGDIAAIDVSRILRVPGFLNHKYDEPRQVRAYLL